MYLVLIFLGNVLLKDHGKKVRIDKRNQRHSKKHQEHGSLGQVKQAEIGGGHHARINDKDANGLQQMPHRHKERVHDGPLYRVIEPGLQWEYVGEDKHVD